MVWRNVAGRNVINLPISASALLSAQSNATNNVLMREMRVRVCVCVCLLWQCRIRHWHGKSRIVNSNFLLFTKGTKFKQATFHPDLYISVYFSSAKININFTCHRREMIRWRISCPCHTYMIMVDILEAFYGRKKSSFFICSVFKRIQINFKCKNFLKVSMKFKAFSRWYESRYSKFLFAPQNQTCFYCIAS